MGLLKAGIGALSGVLADSWRDYFYCESLDADMTIAIYENPYSFDNENWVTLWVKSGGADNMRSVKLRKKPSTGQWFLNDIQCLSEIRLPKEADPWA